MKPTIRVDGESLTLLILWRDNSHCLDADTGRIYPATECPADEIVASGHELAEGKRFVRIPSGDLHDQTQQLASVASADAPAAAAPQDERSQAFAHVVEDLARVQTAVMRWLAGLPLDRCIDWLDEVNCVRHRYDPRHGSWLEVEVPAAAGVRDLVH